ncbi:MAG: hypothetical protein PF495_05380 [Spirochaetales bacterium]|jgi:hypothetical protein|nr:hypothetical protein [Spirochaetales bacterium]
MRINHNLRDTEANKIKNIARLPSAGATLLGENDEKKTSQENSKEKVFGVWFL